MSAAFERAAAVGVKVLGVGNVTDCYGVRVDPATFDGAVERLEQLSVLLTALTPIIVGLRAGDEISTALNEWPEERDREALRVALEPWTKTTVEESAE